MVRIIPCPVGIVQVDKLRKQSDIHEGGDESVLSTQEYIRKVVDDVGKDEDLKVGHGLARLSLLMLMSCTLNALGDLTDSKRYLRIQFLVMLCSVSGSGMLDKKEIIKLLEEEEMADLELQVCGNVNDEEDQYKLDEEALNLALEEEARAARAEQEWLEKCRKEQELDEEHERQL
ncbi:hypothetical protein Tco_1152955 [Tanacetum coccineum]